MIKYFCDRCGKEINYKSYELFKVTVEPPEVRSCMDGAETETYILCYNCVKGISKFISTGELI